MRNSLCRFGSCVGLHLCVYAFMLVQACRSIRKAGPLELAQVSLAVTWPSGLVCMIGSQHLEHGMPLIDWCT